jgi:hypothetical protein
LYMKILELLITIKIYRWMRKNFLEQRQWWNHTMASW